MKRGEAYKLRTAIIESSKSLTDTVAIETPQLFKKWDVGLSLILNERVNYNGKLYKVLQPHTTQSDWTPVAAISLFVEVTPEGVIPVWKQPIGSTDAYAKGDKVHFPTITDPIYESLIAANTWSPSAYPAGWKKL